MADQERHRKLPIVAEECIQPYGPRGWRWRLKRQAERAMRIARIRVQIAGEGGGVVITAKAKPRSLFNLLLFAMTIVALPNSGNADALPNDLDLTATYCLGVALNALERHSADLEAPGGPNLVQKAQDRVHRIKQYLSARGLLPSGDHFNENKQLAAPIAKGREASEAAWLRAGRNKKCNKGCDARDPGSYSQCIIRCEAQFPIIPANDKCADIEARLPF